VGAMVSFGAVLGVDQVQARRGKAAGAMVSWTFRF
jgi:hypothetical protein